MARNRKPEYILKLLRTVAPNGYKFDVANYLHNPNYDHDYPSFRKVIADDGERITYRSVFYIKHYDGTGHYEAQVYSAPKEEANGWIVVRDLATTRLEEAPRFNLNKLLSFC